MPVYELKVASGGPKLKPFMDGGCVLLRPDFVNPDKPSPLKPGQRLCDLLAGLDRDKMVLDAEGVTIDELINPFLVNAAGRLVVNKTGLSGRYVIPLEHAPADGARQLGDARGLPLPPTTAPSIFTALQEQLGLKLESATGPGLFLVVDHIERPTEN